MQTVTTEELLAPEPMIALSEVETTEEESNDDQSHIVPEIEVRKRFFDFTSGADHLTLKLAANGVRVESANKSISKNLSYQGLIKSLSNQATLDTGLLPLLGMDYIAVRRYMIVKNKHFAFIEASPKKRQILYDINRNRDDENYAKFNVPFPGLLLCVVMVEDANGKLFLQKDSCKMFALQTPIINEKIKVFRYPFTNVYDDHKICWGTTLDYMSKTRMQMTIQQAAGLVDIFLTGINNNDLWRQSSNHMKSNDPVKVFKDLEAKYPAYPAETMTEAMSFSGVISLLTQN